MNVSNSINAQNIENTFFLLLNGIRYLWLNSEFI